MCRKLRQQIAVVQAGETQRVSDVDRSGQLHLNQATLLWVATERLQDSAVWNKAR
jgi:hypothetical protein